ncbi:hypothetical protein BC332_25085 [Capsicum chinense]|nr:hypothetical protein BC332_25085 [Capsicum chinense]
MMMVLALIWGVSRTGVGKLRFLHSQGTKIIHRDIKRDNVFVDSGERKLRLETLGWRFVLWRAAVCSLVIEVQTKYQEKAYQELHMQDMENLSPSTRRTLQDMLRSETPSLRRTPFSTQLAFPYHQVFESNSTCSIPHVISKLKFPVALN